MQSNFLKGWSEQLQQDHLDQQICSVYYSLMKDIFILCDEPFLGTRQHFKKDFVKIRVELVMNKPFIDFTL